MVTFEYAEQGRLKRLAAQTHAVDPVVGQHFNLLPVQRAGIGLDRKLVPVGQREPVADECQQSVKLTAVEVRRSPPSQEKRINGLWTAHCPQFRRQRVDVVIDLLVLAGGDGKVAIAAMM